MDERDDASVVARCSEGDRDAYEEIVKRYQRTLFNVALRVLGNYEDARDATQTAFVKAYQHLDGFDRDQRFFNWIYRILKNECLNVLRARRPTGPVSLDLPAVAAPTRWNSPSVSGPFSWRYRHFRWDYREVVALRHFTDLSYDEIAAASVSR